MAIQDRPKHDEISEHELLDVIIGRVKEFLRRYGLHVVLAVAVIALVGVLLKKAGERRVRRDIEAWKAMANLESTSRLREVYPYDPGRAEPVRAEMMQVCRGILEDQPGSTAAPWAKLKLAGLHAIGQEWPDATALYRQIIEDQPDSVVARLANSGLAATLEETGRYGEAAALYKELSGGKTGYDMFAAARCYELAGKSEAARKIYDRLANVENMPALAAAARARRMEIDEGNPLTPPPALMLPRSRPPTPPDEGTEEPPADTAEVTIEAVPSDTEPDEGL